MALDLTLRELRRLYYLCRDEVITKVSNMDIDAHETCNKSNLEDVSEIMTIMTQLEAQLVKIVTKM